MYYYYPNTSSLLIWVIIIFIYYYNLQLILPYVSAIEIPSAQDIGICGRVASTTIESTAVYPTWSCNSYGIPITNPCYYW